MESLSKAHEEHLRELLRVAMVSRDSLPYSEEFNALKQAFYERSFRKLSDQEFWIALINVAKKGGIRGKQNKTRCPDLTPQERDILQKLLPLPIGQRDRLPYTERFDKLVERFNSISRRNLTHQEVWLAVLNLAK